MADVVLLSFQVCMWCVDINSKGCGLSFAHSICNMWMKSHVVINLLKVLTIFQPSCYLGTVMYIYTSHQRRLHMYACTTTTCMWWTWFYNCCNYNVVEFRFDALWKWAADIYEQSSFYWQGGLSTRDEMCLAFPVYYPRTRMSACSSSVNPEAFVPFLNSGRFTQ